MNIKKRPLGITLLSILNFFHVILIFYTFKGGNFAVGTIVIHSLAFRIYYLLGSILGIVLGFGLWKLKKWAYYLFIVKCVYSLIFCTICIIFSDYETLVKIGWSLNKGKTTFYNTVILIGSLLSLLFLIYIINRRANFEHE